MSTPIPRLLTSGEMSRRLKEPLSRIAHILATRPDIQPAALAGRTRLYDNRSMARVKYELNLAAARRAGRGEATRAS
jgi:hypothetical protein